MIADEVEQCLALIRRLSDPAAWQCGEAEVLAALPVLERLARMVAAASVAATAQLDQQGIALARGYASAAGLLMHALHLAPAEAAQRQRMASMLTPEPQPSGALRPARLPATSEAMRDGDISLAHARVIDHTITELPSEIEPHVTADAEVFLAEQARQLNPRQLSALGAKLRARLDHDGLLRDERDAIEDRELFFAHDHRGRVVFRGRLDTETGAALQTAIAALATPQPTHNGERDLRTPARRRADALADLAHRALAQGDLPSSGGERPHVVVTINEIELRERIGSATLTGDTATEVISAGAARRIACDASILPMVLGSRSEPLDVGRASYVVPQPMRRALVTRDQGCAFPGCDRPPGWCDAHHIEHWADGGDTKINNLVLLCGHHHRVIHHDHWDVRITHGQPEFLPPAWIDPLRQPRRRHRAIDPGHLARPGRSRHRAGATHLNPAVINTSAVAISSGNPGQPSAAGRPGCRSRRSVRPRP